MKLFTILHVAYILLLCCSFLRAHNNLHFGDVSCNYSGINVEIFLGNDFEGLIFSRGNYFNPSCSYVPSTVSKTLFKFSLPLMDCGTRIQELNGSIYASNTVIVQKHRYVESALDVEHNITCQLSHDNHLDIVKFWTTENVTRTYTNDSLKAWMDVKFGTDILGPEQPKKLFIGDKFLLVINLKDGGVHQDLRVDNCWAYDGDSFDSGRYALHLYDRASCKTVEWISTFKLTKGVLNSSDSLTYATVQAFKFPTSNKVHIVCSVQVCRNSCLNYCNDEQFEKYNVKTRSKRSNSENLSGDSLRRRYNLMKSTIKALGAKLIEKNKAQVLEEKAMKTNRTHRADDSSLRRRISNTASPETIEVIAPETDGYLTVNESQLNDESNSSENYESNSDISFNDLYTFNLSYTIVVFKGDEFNFEQNQKYSSKEHCIVNMKYITLIGSLCFITFCFFIGCVGLALYLRKEKKRHKINEFLLYQYF